MADDERAAKADRLEVMARGEDGLMHRVEPTSAEEAFGEIVAGCADALTECRAECERLRVIVDLSCAAWEAEAALNDDQLIAGWSDKDSVVYVAEEARLAAVAAEVARRAAL